MAQIRVLVVDDSVVMRRMVTHALEAEPDIEVVGFAANGRLGLAKIEQLRPDAVTLDIEMPEMDGLETLPLLRAAHPDMPVIMCSTLTEQGASATFEALSLGASDYVTKPSNGGGMDAAMEQLRGDLIPKVRALCASVVGRRGGSGPAPAPTSTHLVRSSDRPASRVDAVVIGVSTGGPNALAELIPSLPADLPVPVLICQHMPPTFTRLLAERLDGQSPLRVSEAVHGESVRPGGVWIAPGGSHLEVRRSAGGGIVTALTVEPPENSCRPSVDPLLRSAATTFGAGVLAVILTGMGQDGLRGCEGVIEAGGRAIAQDEATSVVWGMPGYVARAGLADEILPLPAIASAIVRRTSPTAALSAAAESVRH